jgi:hypothetical protein
MKPMWQIEPVELMSAMNFIVRYTHALLAACVDAPSIETSGEMQNENLNQKAIPWKPDFSGFCGRAVVCLFAGSSPAAEGVNYIDLFRTRAIKCIHPTVNPEKATVETVKEPEAKGDTTTVRVKAFYQGLL